VLQSPTAIALSLCEQIIVEEITHNVTLVNCFTRLRVHELPSPPQSLIVFVSLTMAGETARSPWSSCDRTPLRKFSRGIGTSGFAIHSKKCVSVFASRSLFPSKGGIKSISW
jgi:hypothetical protein